MSKAVSWKKSHSHQKNVPRGKKEMEGLPLTLQEKDRIKNKLIIIIFIMLTFLFYPVLFFHLSGVNILWCQWLI